MATGQSVKSWPYISIHTCDLNDHKMVVGARLLCIFHMLLISRDFYTRQSPESRGTTTNLRGKIIILFDRT